jgi:hypothetical protein
MLPVVAVLLFAIQCRAHATDHFVLSDADLPEAVIGECRVAFTRNGAVSVARGDKWLFDAGLGYMVGAWSEWGTQVRRASPTDGWKSDENGAVLVFKGTLFDTNRVPRFHFTQRVSLIDGGIRLRYLVTAPEKRPIEAFGLVAHFPGDLHAGREIELWPGLKRLTLPKVAVDPLLGATETWAAGLFDGAAPLATFVARDRMQWQAFDDRAWNLSTFRLIGWDTAAAPKLAAGEPAEIEFDLLLGDSIRERVAAGDVNAALYPLGWAVISVAGQPRLRGGVARIKKGELTFLPAAVVAGGAEEDDPVAAAFPFSVECANEQDGLTLAYRRRPGVSPAEEGELRLLLAAMLPTGASIVNVDSGEAIAPGAAPVTVGDSLRLSWKEGAKVGRAEDGSYSVKWERSPTVLLSADRPWTITKERDILLLGLRLDDAAGAAGELRLRLSQETK